MPDDISQLLSAIDSGDPKAAQELLPLVYQELLRLAASKMVRERSGHTLQATALVHEACLKLVQESNQECDSRSPALEFRQSLVVSEHVGRLLKKICRPMSVFTGEIARSG